MPKYLQPLPCRCGRMPKLVEVGYTYGAAWDGGCLIHMALQCPRWFFKCLRIERGVSKSWAYHDWQNELTRKWNAMRDLC